MLVRVSTSWNLKSWDLIYALRFCAALVQGWNGSRGFAVKQPFARYTPSANNRDHSYPLPRANCALACSQKQTYAHTYISLKTIDACSGYLLIYSARILTSNPKSHSCTQVYALCLLIHRRTRLAISPPSPECFIFQKPQRPRKRSLSILFKFNPNLYTLRDLFAINQIRFVRIYIVDSVTYIIIFVAGGIKWFVSAKCDEI